VSHCSLGFFFIGTEPFNLLVTLLSGSVRRGEYERLQISSHYEDKQMSKLLSVFIVVCSIIGVATAHAGGCGIGVHRGAYNGCSPVYGGYYNGYYDGYYEGSYESWHDAYYGDYGPSRVVETGLCWGRGTHRVCNSLGLCWRACN
jgi:hypothetical protein